MFLANKLNKGGSLTSVDPQFNYVTMLLHGDGTNGAQNNTFLDSGPNTFTITRNGNTTQGSFSPYGSNWSNYFDGSGDYITAPNNTAFEFGTGDFTVECWVNVQSFTSSTHVIVSTYQNGTNGWTIGITGNIFYGAVAGDIGAVNSSVTPTIGSWTHLALSRSGTTLTLFINGVSSASLSNSTNMTTTSAVTIGTNVGGGGLNFTGYISNLRVVKGTAVYTSAFTPPTTPLTAITNTSLLTCADNRFIDDSASPKTITVNGNTSVQRFNPFGASTAYSTSVIGGSGYFDGSGDYLSVANTTALQFGTGDFTVEGWFYMTGSNFANNTLFSIGSFNGGFLLRYRAAGSDNFYFNNSGYDWNPSTNFRLNQWNHVAVVRSGTTVTVYVNGTSVFSVTNSSSLSQSTATSIGTATHDTNNEACLGYISNFRMVKGTAVYTTAFTPPTAPVTAITNTSLLTNFTNGAIFDNAMMNDLETVGNAQISTSVVKYGTGSLAFDGTGDYLSTPSAPTNQMGSGPFTIEAWIYPTTISGTHSIVGKYVGGSIANSEYWLFITSTGKLAFAVDGSGGEDYVESSAGAIVANTWTYVVAQKSASAIAIYINGTQANVVGSTRTLSTNTTPLNIGSFNNGSGTYFGYIDDLRITKGYARYTANFTPPTAAFPNTGPV